MSHMQGARRVGRVAVAILLLWFATFSSSFAADRDFDHRDAKRLYQDWYERFESDARDFSRKSRERKSSAAQINAAFADSVVPDSLMTTLLGTIPPWDGPKRYYSWTSVLMLVLDDALPAGFGGPFQSEAAPQPSYAGSFVWYMHIHSTESFASAFDDPKLFDPYRLPPHGVLERNAYPFLVFRKRNGRLYLVALSAELAGLVDNVYQQQFM